MYESISPYTGDSTQNEITIQNLINIATDPKLYGALEHKDQKRLITFIVSYTKDCLDSIDKHKLNEQRKEETCNYRSYIKKRSL